MIEKEKKTDCLDTWGNKRRSKGRIDPESYRE